MKHSLPVALIAIMLSTPAISATIDLDTIVAISSANDTTTASENEMFDSATDGPLQYISVEASQSAAGVDGLAAAGVDLTLGASRARASVDKSPGNVGTQATARATTTVRETYNVVGAGRAFAAFTIYGTINSTTDLADIGPYLEAFGMLDIKHIDTFRTSIFSTQSTATPYFQLTNGQFNRKLLIEFDVQDGDTFDLQTVIGADIAFDEFLSAGLLFDVDVKSGLSVYGTDGATITPSAVPLPAGLPLLLAPLGAFALIGRRRKKTQQSSVN